MAPFNLKIREGAGKFRLPLKGGAPSTGFRAPNAIQGLPDKVCSSRLISRFGTGFVP